MASLSCPEVTLKQAIPLIERCMKNRLVPMVHGSPGCGKSAVVQAIAKDYGLKVIDLRLSQCDPTDLSGLPCADKETGKAKYLPPSIFPLEGEEPPKGYVGWLLFLDELPSAPLMVQAAAFKLVLDRQVGEHNLHEKVAIIAAGNKATDKAIVSRMSTPMQSRLIHLPVCSNDLDWLVWAEDNGLDHRVISYIRFSGQVNRFDPDHSDLTFPCERTWDFCSQLIKDDQELYMAEFYPLLTGTVGPGAALEFITYCEVYKNLPTINDIINNPLLTAVPTEPSSMYAITGVIAKHINDKNVKPLSEYIYRMPIEFQIISLKGAVRKTPALLNNPTVAAMLQKNAKRMVA